MHFLILYFMFCQIFVVEWLHCHYHQRNKVKKIVSQSEKKMLAWEILAVFISAIQYPRCVTVWKEFMKFISIIVIFPCKALFIYFCKINVLLQLCWTIVFWHLQPPTIFKGSIQKNAKLSSVLQCFRVMNPPKKFNKTFFHGNFFL